MKVLIVAAALVPLFSCARAGENAPEDVLDVLYSLSLGQNDMLELSVYNPADRQACTSFMNWPGPDDNLRVVGRDGKKWEYVGIIADPVGRPQDIRVAPHAEITITYDIRKNYKPVGSDTRLGKVYFGALFHEC